MNRFFGSLTLCILLLVSAAFILSKAANAKEDLITGLLSMPAPPPIGPHTRPPGRSKASDAKNPPADDAPIEELLEYWQSMSSGYRDLGYNPLPSPRVLERLKAEVERDPEKVVGLVNIFRDSPDGIDLVKRIYDNWPTGESENPEARSTLKRWLTMNSPYFGDQLSRTASKAGERGEYVSNHEELLALAKHDWDAARPTVDRLYSDPDQPHSRVLGMWALYRHALAENSTGDIDRYRRELMDVVENKSATPGMRDLAFDALVKERDWSGRDDWYFTLLEDETLAELRIDGQLYTGLTTIVMYSHPDKYAAKMIELVKSSSRTVRNAAARNLGVILNSGRPDVAEALLPWLEDPKWARDLSDTRQTLVRILTTVKVPGSVDGLLKVLDESETVQVPVFDGKTASNSANMVANAMNTITTSNANVMSNTVRSGKTVTQIRYPLRSEAINALGWQGDIRAVPALRRVLNEVEGYERFGVVKALVDCGGFSVTEQADGVESVARLIREKEQTIASGGNTNTAAMGEEHAAAVTELWTVASEENLQRMVGLQVLQRQDPSDALVREVVARISRLEKSEPETAAVLRKLLLHWRTAAVYSLHLKDVKNGKADPDTVVKLLAARKFLRKKQPGEVFDIRHGDPAAAGISACLLESDADYAAILSGENAETKAAMLACARMVRAKLPLQAVARYLDAADKRLALAAERFLESEDSPAARSIVLSRHPNEVKILGATSGFWPEGKARESVFSGELFESLFEGRGESPAAEADYLYSLSPARQFDEAEQQLKDEVRSDAALTAVYSYDGNHVRIFKDKAVFSWDEDETRFRERVLSKEEFEGLTSYLVRHNVDELPPFIDCRSVYQECDEQQLLMIGKSGGRRVFHRTSRLPEFFAGLEAIFDEMKAEPGARLRYRLEKEIPGLEIHFADENKHIETVWKSGSDLRVLAADKEKEARIEREIVQQTAGDPDEEEEWDEDSGFSARVWELRQKRALEHFGWFRLDDGRLAGPAVQPDAVGFLPNDTGITPPPSRQQWKARAGQVEVRSDDEGLYKITAGRAAKIGDGGYTNIVVTPNGRWAFANRFVPSEGYGLYRIDLATGKAQKIQKGYPIHRPVAFVPSVGRVLAAPMYGDHDDEMPGGVDGQCSCFWLVPETGEMQPARGELRPITQQTSRALQPGPRPNEYWAAISDPASKGTAVGIYDARTFSMRRVMTVPRVRFDSMTMWVDEAGGRVYFVYRGHLLSLPLAPQKRG